MAYTILAVEPKHVPLEFAVVLTLLIVAWLAFIVDACVRMIVTPRGQRAAYFRANRVDMFSALLPMLRPIIMLKYLRSAPGFVGNGGTALRSRVVASAGAYAVLFVYVIALSVLLAERNAPGATIVSLGDAIWWACVTLATVGYGDFTPVTVLGRTFAVALMAGGVVIIGTASAVIVSYLGERINAQKHKDNRDA